MKRLNNTQTHLKARLALSILALGALTAHSQAQVAFTGSYSQNFSSMSSTSTTPPTGWSVVSESGSHATFAPAGSYTAGVSPNFTAGTLTTEPTLTAATPTTQKGVGGYNFANTLATGSNGEGARSLGTSPSGNAATVLELNLVNSTGSNINSLTLGYDIDRFTTTVDNNDDSTSSPNYGVEEYPGYQLFYNLTPTNAATWVNVSSLNPTIDAGTSGPVSAPNSVGITTISNANVTLNSTWTAGSTLALAWFDDNAESPSPDQLLGLNNVSITASVPEPTSFALCLAGGLLLSVLVARRRES